MRAQQLSLSLCIALVAATASVAQAQFSFGSPGPKGEVVMLPEVQKELKITKDQQKQIQAAMTTMSQGANPNMPDMTSMMANMDAQTLAPLNPDQVARLNDLWMQYEGPRVVQDKAVADKLQLTADQKSKIAAIWDGYQQTAMDTMQHMHAGSTMNGVKKALKEANEATLALLAPDQMKTLTEMQGKPFKFRSPKQM